MMRRVVALGVLLLTAVGCASRVPVVTTPAYPDFAFPTVPGEFIGTTEADRHQDAWAYLQFGDLEGADQRFTELVGQNPSFYPAEAGLGWVGLARGEHEVAVDRFERAIALAPAYVPALLGRGEALLANEQVDAALRSFEAALAAEPSLSRIQRVVQELRFTVMTEQLNAARSAAAGRRFEEAARAYERVIAASPESAFLYIELARVEQTRGDFAGALAHVRLANELDPGEPDGFLLEGELHEAAGELERAAAAYRRANALDPTDETERRLRRLRDLALLAGLPAEYREIPSKPTVTRGELAALVGVRLADLLEMTAGGRAVIITDSRNHWGNSWILAVTRARVMAVDAGYRFEPDRAVSRGELAEVVAALLALLTDDEPESARAWQTARPRFDDMGPGHLRYPSASQAVSAGVLQVREGNTFQPTATVGGVEAVEAIERLEALARESGQSRSTSF